MTLPQRLVRTAALVLAVLSALWCSGPAHGAAAQSPAFPFAPGEKLHYDVYWTGIKAAEATLEIMPMTIMNGKPAWHFVMTAQTAPLIAAIYPVHDRMDSLAEADMERALRYTECKRKRSEVKNVSITFDWETNTAHSVKNEKKRLFEIKPGAFDPLSIFYFFRMQELRENLTLSRPVTDRKRCLNGVANVRPRQKVRIGGREWDTWLVEPDLRQIEGVFEKNPGARLQIWVSADERRIPVMIKSTIAVGSFTAQLTGADTPRTGAAPQGTARASAQGD